MKRVFNIAILVIISIIIGFSYGYMVHRNQIFPFKQIKKAYLSNLYRKDMQWTIGIYEGADPFHLSESTHLENPVLSARDVSDVDASFIADPFMVENQGSYYMFFEVLNLNTNTGDIGLAVSEDGMQWSYEKIVLDEEFHLSYPGIYAWEGQYYMIPESSDDKSVRLYRAVSFPYEWEYMGNLLSDDLYYDPTAFFHDNRWWMFTSTVGNGVLNLYYSDSLFSGWKPHPLNPLIEDNPDVARPSGHVFEYENRLYRVAQDDNPAYGIQVYAAEITELSIDSYQEVVDTLNTVVTFTGKGWNAVGMHHVDLHQMDNKWIAVTDGLKRRSRSINRIR
jgi:hypothetical protein